MNEATARELILAADSEAPGFDEAVDLMIDSLDPSSAAQINRLDRLEQIVIAYRIVKGTLV